MTSLTIAGALSGVSTGGTGTGASTGPGLPLMSLNQQVAAFGSSQTLVPPDTQLAAGPTDLVEVTNAVLSVWTKAGQLVSAVDLNRFLGVFVAFSYSSPTTYASVGATGQPAGAAAGTLDPIVTVEPGQGVYCGFDCSGGAGTNRWGDYSAAAQDPVDPSEVWVAGEYAASATAPGDWGTAAEALTASSG